MIKKLSLSDKNLRDFDLDQLIKQYNTSSCKQLEKEGFKNALSVFYQAAERVPAYKNFLKKQHINHEKIITYEDFQKVPIINKKNYLREYPLKDLCWDGKLDNLYILSSSSGSTGEPFLWPRGYLQEFEGTLNHEIIFREIFHSHKYSTLFIICFAMGVWISGSFSQTSIVNLTKKGYPILTITPGLDKEIIFSLFKKLAPQFDQVVFSGYPPFIKDLLDQGKSFGIDWKKYVIKFLFAAEGFSETWRDYVHSMVGAKDALTTSINIYGSADAAILGHETPLTTAIRREIVRINAVEDLFLENRLPTLAQYEPRFKFFEEVNKSLIFTTRAGIPLVRYSIGDQGGVISFENMQSKLQQLRINIKDVLNIENRHEYLWRLPFVYVFGRSDFSVSFYGLIIYPEHIKYCLEKSKIQRCITGKFVMSIIYDNNHNPLLLIRAELKRNVKPSIKIRTQVQSSIVKELQKVNSEYAKLKEHLKKRTVPIIQLIEYGNLEYFRPGAKQRWVS